MKGYDFNKGLDYSKVFETLKTSGFQATNLGLAIDEVNKMINWRLSDEEWKETDGEELKSKEEREKVRCTIFLGHTSNQISCGMREYIRYLCQHKMISCIVTTSGAIEEDFMKCLAPHYIGDFTLKGKELRLQGINRTGNLLVPNNNYCLFEAWFKPLLDELYEEQIKEGKIFSPSKIIARMGQKINHEESAYYWCWKNDIPVFCPAFTDGACGDVIYFDTYRRDPDKQFVVDLVSDIRKVNDMALHAYKSGAIILGAGVVKHHIMNANIMRNGADFTVYMNTAQEYDGSDSGARPDEAISWGKIKIDAKPVKVYTETSLVLPILIGETFVKNFDKACRIEKEVPK